LSALGTAWDKRLSFEEWCAVIDAVSRSGEADPSPEEGRTGDPRALSDAVARHGAPERPTTRPPTVVPPDAAAGRKRFQRYVDGLAHDATRRPGLVYPDLPSRPWLNPEGFPLVAYLESHFEEIRGEIRALRDGRFHRESERISRTGDWDVAFLYERGRRHEEVCAACPVTTRGVETHPAIRTLAGLIYVSRMRGHTHIEAHRGPTNVRVRCHLGVEVPDGDCAIRVGDQTRRWTEGRCLVFDDYCLHEAWNHTDEDRLVLIVDLWHPGLSDAEVTLLQGLHTYTRLHAERLVRYWAANARVAGQTGRDASH
jgi:aspartate beta-hydroxylase